MKSLILPNKKLIELKSSANQKFKELKGYCDSLQQEHQVLRNEVNSLRDLATSLINNQNVLSKSEDQTDLESEDEDDFDIEEEHEKLNELKTSIESLTKETKASKEQNQSLKSQIDSQNREIQTLKNNTVHSNMTLT